jgi:hypothetical protein
VISSGMLLDESWGERVRSLDEGGDLELGLSKSYCNRELLTCLPRSDLLDSKLLGSSSLFAC